MGGKRNSCIYPCHDSHQVRDGDDQSHDTHQFRDGDCHDNGDGHSHNTHQVHDDDDFNHDLLFISVMAEKGWFAWIGCFPPLEVHFSVINYKHNSSISVPAKI